MSAGKQLFEYLKALDIAYFQSQILDKKTHEERLHKVWGKSVDSSGQHCKPIFLGFHGTLSVGST
jgi:hypothetical protein